MGLNIDFDDCKDLCLIPPDDIRYRKKGAKRIDKYLMNSVNKYSKYTNYRLYFDYNNIKELQEGCWPILVDYKNIIEKWEITKKEGILFKENCD